MWQYNPGQPDDSQQMIQKLLLSDTWNNDELKKLNQEQQAQFMQALTLAIEELDKVHSQLLGYMSQAAQMPVNKLVWENNHLKITRAIFSAIARTERMPSQAYIARATGLSRRTVQQHIQKSDDPSTYNDHLSQYTLMAPRVMDVVLSRALTNHDMKAVKLYFGILEKLKGANISTIYNTQNNYIQINNTVIKQEIISLLAPEQLRQIEELMAQWLPLDPNQSPFGPDVSPVDFSEQ